jgi:hypothetical protein
MLVVEESLRDPDPCVRKQGLKNISVASNCLVYPFLSARILLSRYIEGLTD